MSIEPHVTLLARGFELILDMALPFIVDQSPPRNQMLSASCVL